MLLSEQDIGAMTLPYSYAYINDVSACKEFVRTIEAAILAKLAAKELPEPAATVERTSSGIGATISEYLDCGTCVYTADQLHQAHAQGFAAGAASQLSAEPVAVMHRGELCIKSTDDDQSFGMLCPTTISEGTELYTRREA